MEYIAAYLGVLKAGCAVVPLNMGYPRERMGYIARDCCAKLIIRQDFFDDIDRFEAYFAPAGDAAPALLFNARLCMLYPIFFTLTRKFGFNIISDGCVGLTR